MAECVNALRAWTGKASASVVYDSTVDEFTGNGLFEIVKDKPNVAIVGFTTDGDVFGGFYHDAEIESVNWFLDPSMFIFSFESHGRCKTPQRFVVKEEERWRGEIISLTMDGEYGFVFFGVGCGRGFYLGNEKSFSYCDELSRAFEGLEDTTLTGQSGRCWEGPYHHCSRLVAVQLE